MRIFSGFSDFWRPSKIPLILFSVYPLSQKGYFRDVVAMKAMLSANSGGEKKRKRKRSERKASSYVLSRISPSVEIQ